MATNEPQEIQRNFLDLQREILSNFGFEGDAVDRIAKLTSLQGNLTERLIKDVHNELDARKLIVENVQSYADSLSKVAKSNENIIKQSELLKQSNEIQKDAEIYAKALENAEGFIDGIVGKIPFMSQGMKENVANSMKDALSPIFDSMAQFQETIVETFSHLPTHMKLGIVGVVSLLFGAISVFKDWDNAIQSFIKSIGVTRSSAADLLDISKQVFLMTGKYSIEIDEVLGVAEALVKEYGSMQKINKDLLTTTVQIEHGFSLSADAAASLVRLQKQSLGLTTDQMKENVKLIKVLGDQLQIGPGAIAQDLVDASDKVAMFSKGNNKNIIQAAAYALKLGVHLNDVAQIAENLFDIESSTQAAMEAQIIWGRQINLAEARRQAMLRNIPEAISDILDQFSQFTDVSQLNYLQVKSLSNVLSVAPDKARQMLLQFQQNKEVLDSMDESMQSIMKQVSGKSLDQLLDLSGVQSQLHSIWALIKYSLLPIMDPILFAIEQILIGLEWILKGVGKLTHGFGLIKNSISESSLGLKAFKFILGASLIPLLFKAGKMITGLFSNILGGVLGRFGGALGKIGGIAQGAGKGFGNMFGFLKVVNPKQLLATGAAMIMISGAIFILAKAMQQFSTGVNWKGVGIAAVSLLGLVGAVAALGAIMSSGVGTVAILAGAAAMGIMAGGLYVLGKALQVFSSSADKTIPFFQSLTKIDGKRLLTVGAGLTAIAGSLAAFTAGNIINTVGGVFTTLLGGGLFKQLAMLSAAAPNIRTVGESLETIMGINNELKLDYMANELNKLVQPLENIADASLKARNNMLSMAGENASVSFVETIGGMVQGLFKSKEKPGAINPATGNPKIQIVDSDVVLDGRKVGKVIFKYIQGEM